MELSFGLTNAANDWFWAVDNISLSAGAATLASVTPTPGRVAAGARRSSVQGVPAE